MLYTVIDIETSGFHINVDSILSMSYYSFDDATGKRLDSGVLYFWKETGMRWTEDAYAVHGLSREFLKQHRDDFDKNMAKMYKIMQKGAIIGFNNDQFDNRFILSWFSRHNYPTIYMDESIDLMKVFRPYMGKARFKLSTLCESLNITDSIVKLMISDYFPGEEYQTHQHDAAYDVVMTHLAYVWAKRKGMV